MRTQGEVGFLAAVRLKAAAKATDHRHRRRLRECAREVAGIDMNLVRKRDHQVAVAIQEPTSVDDRHATRIRRRRRSTRTTRGYDHQLSDYLLSSSARDLLERIRPDLEESGIDVPHRQLAATALDDLLAVIHRVSERLDLA
jgi:hypothetical protein